MAHLLYTWQVLRLNDMRCMHVPTETRTTCTKHVLYAGPCSGALVDPQVELSYFVDVSQVASLAETRIAAIGTIAE